MIFFSINALASISNKDLHPRHDKQKGVQKAQQISQSCLPLTVTCIEHPTEHVYLQGYNKHSILLQIQT